MARLRQVALLVAIIVVHCDSQQSQTPSWLRPRRQFPGSEWVPLSRPCPTCRPFADPSDSRTNFDDIGLVPPRPPLAPRQVQGTSTFFPQPPPSPLQQQQQQQNVFPHRQRFPDFPAFSQFQQHQPFFTPQQQQAFLPQTYLNNHQLLLNENPQLLPLVNNQQLLNQLNQQKPQLPAPQQQHPKENQIRFRPEAPKFDLKPPQNIRLEQDKNGPTNAPVTRLELPLNSPPTPFHSELPAFQQNSQQFQIPQFPEQQPQFPVNQPQFGAQQQQFPVVQEQQFAQQQQFPGVQEQPFPQQQLPQVNTRDPFLAQATPTTAANNSDLVIPGLDKEEIQLLYVPVETLRQRGQLQGHTLEEQRPAFFNQGFSQFQQLQQTPTGHFITQPPVTTQEPNPSGSPTPPPALSQNLPLRENGHQFSTASATASPSTLPVTEQVVTIHPRPVSTIGLSHSRKTTQPPRAVSTTSFHSNTKDVFSNEVTPSFSSSGSDVPRATHSPQVETATEITIPTTTLQPHQPHLSIYVGQEKGEGRIVDILHELKNLEEISVIDSYQEKNPTVFVGPGNLNPPQGYNRFELPYLSNLEPSRIEQRDNLPFFVAPLNFNSPQGYSKIAFPAPHVGAVVYLDENELEKEVPVTTTTTRPRNRRPPVAQYKQSSRRPVSRQRVTPKPQEPASEAIESQKNTQDVLRETQQERRRPNSSRRQRVRTTTEAVTESDSSDTSIHEAVEPHGASGELNAKLVDFDATQVPQQNLQSPVHSAVNFHTDQPQMSPLQQPRYPQDDFVPPPHPSVFEVKTTGQPLGHNQFQFTDQPKFEMFHPTPEEIQGMFDLPTPTNRPQTPSEQIPVFSTTDRPAQNEFVTSSIGQEYEEDTQRPGLKNESESGTESEQIEKEVEAIEIPKKKSKYSGVKTQTGSNNLRSPVRSRPRGSTTGPEKQVDNVDEVTPVTEPTKTTSKYMSHFNRSRKPLRPTSSKPAETTTTTPPTRGYTVKPLRRSTMRTSVSTKRIRKPTTPLPSEEDALEEQLNEDHKFVPSAASNEIYDEQPVSSPKPRPRKPYFKKKSTEEATTPVSISTRSYNVRNGEEQPDDDRAHEPSASGDYSPLTALSSEGDERKKVYESDNTKKARRRLRVKVQKRPQDNFEAAESQNHGSVSNLLVQSSQKPTAPDLYRFGKGEFDFQDTEKFIATHNKDYARNITAEILENTQSFSSPGSDTTVQLVTIVSDHTTVLPEMNTAAALVASAPGAVDASPEEPIKETLAPDVTPPQETTTSSTTTTTAKDSVKILPKQDMTLMPIETTTEYEESPTTMVVDATSAPISPQTTTTAAPAAEKSERKVLRTSTTTQVSHETEICYKGKCIKTNSDNPDAALKRLVEEANAEESSKVKT